MSNGGNVLVAADIRFYDKCKADEGTNYREAQRMHAVVRRARCYEMFNVRKIDRDALDGRFDCGPVDCAS